MRIGFLSIHFQRGQAYITKTIMNSIEGHELFVFARTGAVYGINKFEESASWNIPNLTRYHTYKVYIPDFIDWIEKNKLDMIVFNEEYDWDLVSAVKEKTRCKIVTYLDFYMDAWKDLLNIYHEVWCSTQRTYNLVKDFCNAKYIGFGVDTELFKPTTEIMSNVRRDYVESKNIFFPKSSKHTFFHNAGWLGNNYRKNTPYVTSGFNEASKVNADITLFVHSQAEANKLPPDILNIVQNNNRITYYIGDIDHPGLYHRGKILVFISKLEGLGLPLLEGMACGMPVIATDEPPMNEIVIDGITGDLIPVVERKERYDHVAFPEAYVNYDLFVNKLLTFEGIDEKGKKAREFICENYSMQNLKEKLVKLL